MKRGTNGFSRAQKSKNYQGEGPNWLLLAGGALLSTLSIRLGYKIKKALDTKRLDGAANELRGNAKFTEKRRSGACTLHSNGYSVTQDESACYNFLSGLSDGVTEVKRPPISPMLKVTDMELPLVTIPAPELNRENGLMWSSSPDCLEPPRKQFHHSNSSDSPCVSDSGSDIFTKREVIHKLRQQLKRRDEMILEMQDQITELQSSLNAQVTHSTLLQSLVDSANSDLFESEREIQRLRKAIADHCVEEVSFTEKPAKQNGFVNGYHNRERNFGFVEERGNGEKIEMLKYEVGELKDVIEGKNFLLQSYKEQKVELSSKIKELEQRLASQVPNIL